MDRALRIPHLLCQLTGGIAALSCAVICPDAAARGDHSVLVGGEMIHDVAPGRLHDVIDEGTLVQKAIWVG